MPHRHLPVGSPRLSPFAQALGLSVTAAGSYVAALTLLIVAISPEYLLFALPARLRPETPLQLVGIWTLIHLVWMVLPMSTGLAVIWTVGSLPVLRISWLIRALGRLLITISAWSALFALVGASIGATLERSAPAEASPRQRIVDSSEFRSMEMLAFSSMIVGWTATMLLVGRISRRRSELEAGSLSLRRTNAVADVPREGSSLQPLTTR